MHRSMPIATQKGENRMELFNNGHLDVDEHDMKKFVEVLRKNKLITENLHDFSGHYYDGKYQLIFDEENCTGNIENVLRESVEELAGMGIYPEGRIDYFGDYEGGYEIGAGKVTVLSSEECVVRDLDDDEVIAEANRRNLYVTGGRIYVLFDCDEWKSRAGMTITATSTSPTSIIKLIEEIIKDGSSMKYGGDIPKEQQIAALWEDFKELGAPQIASLNQRLEYGFIEVYDDYRKTEVSAPCSDCAKAKTFSMFGKMVKGCDMSHCDKADEE